jgi:Flp pilus assembly protein TadB
LRDRRAGSGEHVYGHWFLSTYFWIGLVLLVLATAFFFSPLIALLIAAVAGAVFLFGAAMRRTRKYEAQGHDSAPSSARPPRRPRGAGAPVSGEGR